MKLFYTNQKAVLALTITALIVNIAISGISNSSTISFLIKLVSSSILFLFFFIHLKISDFSLKSFYNSYAIKKILLIIITIIVYLGITLSYSLNPAYGAQKIINILISVVPNIIVLYYLITFADKELFKNYSVNIIAVGLILTLIAVLIFQPFDHSTIYQFSPQRWSHVFIGRMVSFLSLIVFLFIMSAKDFNKIIIYSIIFTIGMYLTYLTGLRSALIGLMLFAIISLGWSFYKKNLTAVHLYSIFLILILTATFIFITPEEFTTSERISNMLKIENLEFGGDAPILTRVESYKISWQMFEEKPLFGWGLGGFNGFNNIEWTRIQKYPHNLILEILAELGIMGFLVFSALFVVILKAMLNAKSLMFNGQKKIFNHKFPQTGQSSIQYPATILSPHFLLLTFFFCLWLAMFSKDISTQGFLWLFIVFVGEWAERIEQRA